MILCVMFISTCISVKYYNLKVVMTYSLYILTRIYWKSHFANCSMIITIDLHAEFSNIIYTENITMGTCSVFMINCIKYCNINLSTGMYK